MTVEIPGTVREFLEAPHFAVVSTIAPDGMPHQTVMWYLLDGDTLVLNTPSLSLKHKHLQRDPRISICIEAGYRFVTFTGTATLDENPEASGDAYKRLGARYQSTMSERPPLDPTQMDPKMLKLLASPRVGIRVTITNAIFNIG